MRRAPHRAPPRRREWLGVLALVLGGCGSTCGDSSNPGTVGELGNGRFEYLCGGPSDPVCEDEDMPGQFPECIAVGGVFGLEYVLLDTSILDPTDPSPLIYVDSVNNRFFDGEDQFEALRTGEAAFIVREGQSVLDLIHLRIIEPNEIEVLDDATGNRVTSLELTVGGPTFLDVFPRSTTCSRLGGAIFVTAESSDPSVVVAISGQQVRIEGQSLGQATVRLRYADIEVAIPVEVTDGDFPFTSGTDPTTGGESTEAEGTTSGTEGTEGTGTTGGTSSGSSTGGSTTGGTN